MARIPYDFTPFPRKLHPGWAGRSHASWGLCLRLWLLAEGQPIQVHGADWRASLCQQMGIGGRDRPTTRALMADLQVDGLMTVVSGFVHVQFHPNQGAPGTTELVPELVGEGSARGSTGVQPGVRQESYPSDLSVDNHSDRFLQTDRQKEEKERGRAREDFVPARRPVGEPPADFVETFQEPDPEPKLEDQILNAWKRAVHDKTTRTPGSTKLATDGAAEVAAWLRENVRGDETPLSAFQVALKLYLAEDKESLVKASWPLKWLTERLPGYLAAKQPATAPKSNNPTHQVWKAPDYAAEQRESEERYLREREEWFAQHPELRAEVEEQEREMREAKPRVVVSIAEAPKPPRAVRTAEDLEARKRFLQEQAKQLLAAKAAQ